MTSEGVEIMIRALGGLVLIADCVGIFFSVAVAVDVILQNPYDWMRTGSSQRFRMFLIFAPVLTIPLAFIYLAPGVIYLKKVRPLLMHNARVALSQGWPSTPRRPILGINWAWWELRTAQRVRAVISGGCAFFLEASIADTPQAQDGPPQWLTYTLLIFLWPLFYFVIYLALGVAWIFLRGELVSNISPASRRIEALAQEEYGRRVAEFYKKNHPRGPWG